MKQLVRHSPELLEKVAHIEQDFIATHAVGLQWVQATLSEDWNREPELSRKFFDLSDDLKQNIAVIKGDGLQEFEHSINQITEQTAIVWASTSLVFLLGFGCFILITFRLYRSITVPIRGLLTVVSEISKDEHDLSQRVVIGANDEIGQLGSAFNRMLESLERSQRKIREYTTGLEEKVRERTVQLQQEKEALLESEQHLQAIWDTIPSGVVVIDRETHQIIDANPFARRLMDRTQEELIGRECHSFICPAEKGKCPITDLGQKVDGSERKLVTAKGHTMPILKTVIPFIKQGRNLLIESFIDISDLKTTQDQLKATSEAAEASSRAKSEFLANMSHELRTPLNHIIGFTELVVSRNFGELTVEQDEFLNDVLSSSRHLLSLINDVLDLAKVEAGKMELELSAVRIRELLENSLVMVKEKALRQQLRLGVELDGAPELLLADERKLKQVVYNLLSNAVKFTPAGGEVRLGARVMEASELGHYPEAGELNGDSKWLSLWVADTGIGLERKQLERIFKPFEQVESSLSRKFQGTGLGLALTRKMVELHGGAIWVESQGAGAGSTFRLAIPLREPAGNRQSCGIEAVSKEWH